MFFDKENIQQLWECKWIILVVMILFVLGVAAHFHYHGGTPPKAERVYKMPESSTGSSSAITAVSGVQTTETTEESARSVSNEAVFESNSTVANESSPYSSDDCCPEEGASWSLDSDSIDRAFSVSDVSAYDWQNQSTNHHDAIVDRIETIMSTFQVLTGAIMLRLSPEERQMVRDGIAANLSPEDAEKFWRGVPDNPSQTPEDLIAELHRLHESGPVFNEEHDELLLEAERLLAEGGSEQ